MTPEQRREATTPDDEIRRLCDSHAELQRQVDELKILARRNMLCSACQQCRECFGRMRKAIEERCSQ